jgi:hypothetical protein
VITENICVITNSQNIEDVSDKPCVQVPQRRDSACLFDMEGQRPKKGNLTWLM